MTSGNNALPLRARHEFCALSVNLNTIARQATREPEPFVLPVRSRTLGLLPKTGTTWYESL